MAHKRHKAIIPIIHRSRKKRGPSHAEKLRFISRLETVRDPTSRTSTTRQYNLLKNLPLRFTRKIRAKDRKDLRERGFTVTKKGLIIDGPRDSQQHRIPSSKLRINKKGVVVWSVKQRRDYIIGLTIEEKKEFARNPLEFQKKKLKELRKRFPEFRKGKRSKVHLQWGSYGATKEFAIDEIITTESWKQFVRIILNKHPKRKDTDILTGLHIVVHVPKPRSRKKGKRNHGKSRRRS